MYGSGVVGRAGGVCRGGREGSGVSSTARGRGRGGRAKGRARVGVAPKGSGLV